MAALLTEEQELLYQTIVQFARRELNDDVQGRDRDAIFPHDLWLKCGEMSLQGLPVPEQYGGLGVDPLTTSIALEALGYACEDGGLVFALSAHLLSCVVPVWKYGSEKQKQRYLPGLCSGKLIAVNGMTEPGSGSDAFAMSTRAERDGDDYVLNGRKMFSSNGPNADLGVIYALTDSDKGYAGGVTCFLIDRHIPGFEPGQQFSKMGLRTCPIGELILDDVRLPSDAVLGKEGDGAAIFGEAILWERTCLAAGHIGTMARLLEKCVDYARTRSASGQKIGRFQAVSHKVADMKVRLETARLLAYHASSKLDHVAEATLYASMTKLYVSESLVKTGLETIQLLGGYGFMTEYEVERALRDAVGSTIYSGTSEIQRNIIAGWLGL